MNYPFLMSGQILVGTASWTDPGFLTSWYPPGLPASQRLPFYAERFQLVEVNSSFYAVPAQKVVQRWCDQTPDGFTFNVKLHRLLSRHSTTAQSLPPALRSLAEVDRDKVKLTPVLERALTKVFLEEIDPLCSSGKLGALLLQLTPSFSPHRNKLEELDNLLECLSGHVLGIELRNRHWVMPSRLPDTRKFFEDRQLTWVGVDAPATEHFMAMPGLDLSSNPQLAYLRLHGRNAKGYISGKTVAERFDYFYTDQEIQGTIERARHLAEKATRTHVVYNNNFSDYPLRNAATFQQLLRHGQTPAPGLLPPFPASRSSSASTREPEFGFTADMPRTKPSHGRQ
jgi:uncharacterized protein YecE (DUF72 family)